MDMSQSGSQSLGTSAQPPIHPAHKMMVSFLSLSPFSLPFPPPFPKHQNTTTKLTQFSQGPPMAGPPHQVLLPPTQPGASMFAPRHPPPPLPQMHPIRPLGGIHNNMNMNSMNMMNMNNRPSLNHHFAKPISHHNIPSYQAYQQSIDVYHAKLAFAANMSTVEFVYRPLVHSAPRLAG